MSAGSNSSFVHSKNAPPACGGQCISGAPAGIRTPDTLLKRQVLCLLSYWGICMAGMAGLEPTISESKSGVLPLHYIPIFLFYFIRTGPESGPYYIMGWVKGLEPSTPGTTIRCSNQLSYTHHTILLARQEGFEPPTYCLEGSCSILLSYWRIYSRSCGAGDGNRTHVSSLEGWCSTIELRPHEPVPMFSFKIIPIFLPLVKY